MPSIRSRGACAFEEAGALTVREKEFVRMSNNSNCRSIGLVNSRLTACTTVVTLMVGLSAFAVAPNITGTVTDVDGPALQGAQVTFFDAENAEMLASVATGVDGTYDSGLIPVGNYRVFFSASVGDTFFAAEFFGAGGTDSFCSATVVAVSPGSTNVVNEAMIRFHGGPEAPPLGKVGGLAGRVRNAVTGLPLSGIEVRIFDPITAGVVAITETDAEGAYTFSLTAEFPGDSVRVRFSDPDGAFLPQFFVGNAAGPDDFCEGSVVSVRNGNTAVDASLESVPPAQLTEGLSETIEALNLPSSVESMLRTPLTQAVALLTDANPNNDAGVCGHLRSFVTRIDVQERRGQLGSPDAAALRASAGAILAAMGCQ
jgi:hypothetical protein